MPGWSFMMDNCTYFGGSCYNDLWRFNLTSQYYSWISGSTSNEIPVYGKKNDASQMYSPGSRDHVSNWVSDHSGNLFFFGGEDCRGNAYADLWKFSARTLEWSWIAGNQKKNAYGVFGSLGVFSSDNHPSSTGHQCGAIELSKRVIMYYGGSGFVSPGALGTLWAFDLEKHQFSWLFGDSINPKSGYQSYSDFPYTFSLENNPGPLMGSQCFFSHGFFVLMSGYDGFRIQGGVYAFDFQRLMFSWIFQQKQVGFGGRSSLLQGQLDESNIPPSTYDAITLYLNDDTLCFYSGIYVTEIAGSQIWCFRWNFSKLNFEQDHETESPSIETSLSGGKAEVANFPACDRCWMWKSGGSNDLSFIPNLLFRTKTPIDSVEFPNQGRASFGLDHQGNVYVLGGSLGVPSNALIKIDRHLIDVTWIAGYWTNRTGVYTSQGEDSPFSVPPSRPDCGMVYFDGFIYLTAGHDLWRFNLSSQQFAWLYGTDIDSVYPVYGQKDFSSRWNTPGSRILVRNWIDDRRGKLYMFGGYGKFVSSSQPFLADMWKFDAQTLEWAWIGGSKVLNDVGVYGSIGIFSPNNRPAPTTLQCAAFCELRKLIFLYGGASPHEPFLSPINTLWAFDLVSQQFAWLSGSSTNPFDDSILPTFSEFPNVFSTMNQPGLMELPQCYSVDRFFIVSGYGKGTGKSFFGQTVFAYDIDLKMFAWLFKQPQPKFSGIYHKKGEFDPLNIPPNHNAGVPIIIDGSSFCSFLGHSDVERKYNEMWCFRWNLSNFVTEDPLVIVDPESNGGENSDLPSQNSVPTEGSSKTHPVNNADPPEPEKVADSVDEKHFKTSLFCKQPFCSYFIWFLFSTWCIQGINTILALFCGHNRFSMSPCIILCLSLFGDSFIVLIWEFTSYSILISYCCVAFFQLISQHACSGVQYDHSMRRFKLFVFIASSSGKVIIILLNIFSLSKIDFLVFRLILEVLNCLLELKNFKNYLFNHTPTPNIALEDVSFKDMQRLLDNNEHPGHSEAEENRGIS
jgi:hypothetical protein